jgi:hypothetical protein
MELKASEKLLEKYKKYVIQQARANLSKGRNNVSKTLYNSLKGEVVSESGYAIVAFRMEQYGQFLDEGVKGAFPNMVKNGKQKAPNSRFMFTNKRPPADAIAEWAKKRNIRLRDAEGKFKKGNYKTLGFIIANRIYAQGMKPTLFFTKPYEEGFKKFIVGQMPTQVAIDVDRIVDYNLKEK